MKKIEEFFKKVFINFYHRLTTYDKTEIEKKVQELIESIIDLPSTNKIMTSSRYMYLANKEKSVYVIFNGISLSIIKDDDYIDMICSPGFADIIQGTVENFMDKSITSIEKTIQDRKYNKISNIIKTLKQK